jgi:hypothetical protein
MSSNGDGSVLIQEESTEQTAEPPSSGTHALFSFN